jgi:hypothetical protein
MSDERVLKGQMALENAHSRGIAWRKFYCACPSLRQSRGSSDHEKVWRPMILCLGWQNTSLGRLLGHYTTLLIQLIQ